MAVTAASGSKAADTLGNVVMDLEMKADELEQAIGEGVVDFEDYAAQMKLDVKCIRYLYSLNASERK